MVAQASPDTLTPRMDALHAAWRAWEQAMGRRDSPETQDALLVAYVAAVDAYAAAFDRAYDALAAAGQLPARGRRAA